MSVKLELSSASLSAFRQNVLLATQRVITAADAGLTNTANKAYNVTQTKIPKVTGALARSGHVTEGNSDNTLRRTIGYGDSTINPRTKRTTASYAVRVHEVFNPRRPNSYKWFELCIQNFGQTDFLNELAKSIRSSL